MHDPCAGGRTISHVQEGERHGSSIYSRLVREGPAQGGRRGPISTRKGGGAMKSKEGPKQSKRGRAMKRKKEDNDASFVKEGHVSPTQQGSHKMEAGGRAAC